MTPGLLTRGIVLSLVLLACSCAHKQVARVFTELDSVSTGIRFSNLNTDTDSLSILDYLYFYNGAGVAIGDINNDGLPDIYFASNTGGNKLFLNKGSLRFQDITSQAGVAGKADWTTGVSMVDINGDGLLDIYVCTVANHDPHDRNGGTHKYFTHSRNQLFINHGDNTFTEEAEKYGLAIQGYCTQAAFFDYDKDGDLDMFLLEHTTHHSDTYDNISLRNTYSNESGGKLYRNDGNHFTDVTAGSGILSTALGYGLGVSIGDLNQDGYDDIYVGNDFHENDYYYVNLGNGHFREMNQAAFGHESKFSMGNVMADINNDGWLDIMTVDMLPPDEKNLKTALVDDPLGLFMYQQKFGFTYQSVRNCLQLNTGRGRKFSDIALYSGVAATDWSWGPLIADFDLDGRNDIFVSNGIKNRPNDLDYIKFISGLPQHQSGSGQRVHDREILKNIPRGEVHHYIFEGMDSLLFRDRSLDWGLERPGLAQGAAYSDLDGDGDLELITNNMNENAGVFQNNSRTLFPASAFLEVKFKGKSPNPFGIGTKIFLYCGGKLFFQELETVKGFMSSCEPVLHFGLGKSSVVDSMFVLWPDNSWQKMERVAIDQKLTISYRTDSVKIMSDVAGFINKLLKTPASSGFTDITAASGLTYVHREDAAFNDFSAQRFLPHRLSTAGPKIAVADINADGLEDFFICGARGQGGNLFLQTKAGAFVLSPDSAVFVIDKNCEDADAVFFDANGDGYPDLYVASGGGEFEGELPELLDRLYLNDGRGRFQKSADFPALYGNKSVVRIADFDKDGDMDIFVGGRANANIYGKPPVSYLLKNDGKGHFSLVTDDVASGLRTLGLVTGAVWTDVDNDGWPDLLVTGEWMPPALFKNDHGRFARTAVTDSDEKLSGWWSAVQSADVNGDGYADILMGNLGLNSKFSATSADPLKMYVGDFAGNNKLLQLLSDEKNEKYYPFLTKEILESQLPFLKKQYLSAGSMAGKTTEDIFGDKLKNTAKYQITTLTSMILINDGKGHFAPSVLPDELQWSPVSSFEINDFNGDGKPDLLAGGNFYGTIPYEGRYDAMPLCLSYGDGKGHFTPQLPLLPPFDTLTGELRSLKTIHLATGKTGVLVGINNAPVRLFQF